MGTSSSVPAMSAASTTAAPPAKRSSFIPAITDLASARKVGKQGAWAAFIGGGITAVAAAIAGFSPQVTQELGVNVWAFVDAAFFLGLGIGIWRMSRVCAVLGLAFYALERIFMAIDHPANASKGLVVVVILVTAYVNGIRGTFAFHRFKKAIVPPPIPTGSLSPK